MNKKQKTNKSLFPLGFTSPEALSGTDGSASVLVAFSGGADSRALLDLLVKHSALSGYRVYAAHVNHCIRGEEADRDENFCTSVAKKYGIELFVKKIDIPALAKETSKSVELCARDERYAFFAKIMKEHSIPLLATAHNANDCLETMIFNLTRGTGLAGLSGIPPIRECDGGLLVRPILNMSRDDILLYCKENELDFVTDSTNLDTDYTRNKIRAGVIPVLKQICPAAERRAVATASLLKKDEELLSSLATEIKDRAHNGDGTYNATMIAEAHEALSARVIMSIFSDISDTSLDKVHVTDVMSFLNTSTNGRISLPGGFCAVKKENSLSFLKSADIADEKKEEFEIIAESGENFISQINAEIVIGSSHKEINIYKKSIQLDVSSATINGTLTLRERRAGDKIFIGGMHKSVKKLMCDKKIPQDVRYRIPIICDDNGILAIPFIGVRDSSNPKKCNAEDRNKILSIKFYLY